MASWNRSNNSTGKRVCLSSLLICEGSALIWTQNFLRSRHVVFRWWCSVWQLAFHVLSLQRRYNNGSFFLMRLTTLNFEREALVQPFSMMLANALDGFVFLWTSNIVCCLKVALSKILTMNWNWRHQFWFWIFGPTRWKMVCRFAMVTMTARGTPWSGAHALMRYHLERETVNNLCTWYARVPTETDVIDCPSRNVPHPLPPATLDESCALGYRVVLFLTFLFHCHCCHLARWHWCHFAPGNVWQLGRWQFDNASAHLSKT